MGRKTNFKTTTVEARRIRRLSTLSILLVLGAVTILVSLRGFRAVGLDRSEEISKAEAVSRPTHSFEPTKVNEDAAPPAPDGMVWIPGGEFSMGATDPPDKDEIGMHATEDARPIHRVYVDGFFMDTTDVTNAQFEKFVKATGYVTVAERTPKAEDFPGAPPENLVAGSVVFSPPDHPVPLNNHFQWWS